MTFSQTGDAYRVPTERWTLTAVADEVGPARRAAVRFASENEIADPPLSDVALAISEALTNVIVHAYRDEHDGTIDMTMDVLPAKNLIRVVVRDSGAGVAPRSDSPGLGLGLPLIAQATETFEVHAGPGGVGTEVRMTFRVPAQGG